MNLTHQYCELKEIYSDLNLNAAKRNDNNYQINGWMNISNNLNTLMEFKYLKKQVKDIFSIDDNINIRNDTWIAIPKTYNELTRKLETLKKSIESCIILIESYIYKPIDIPEDKGLLTITMPNNLDMNKMANLCNGLDKVFNQCSLIKDEVKFISVERGSVLFLFITTTASIKVIGTLLNVALDVQRNYYENQITKAKLETMSDIKDSVSKIIKKLDDEVEEYARQKASDMEEAQGLDNEQINRLTLSISTLSSLIRQGVQMQCTLAESAKMDEVTDITFPSLEEFKAATEGVKMLKSINNN